VSSYSYAETFSRTHARRLAGRVTTDLRQSYLLYGSPTESRLEEYRAELEELLSEGYVDRYQFGFKRDGTTLWSLRYAVGPDGSLTGAGTAGGVPAGVNITGATFFNFLIFSENWFRLSRTTKAIDHSDPVLGARATTDARIVETLRHGTGGLPHARAVIFQLRDELRALRRTLRPSELHLFLAMPAACALLLGNAWDRMPPTWTYWDLGLPGQYAQAVKVGN
jgi:Bacterial HORMA domain family 1/SMODS-associated and fused to various effectors sensor domain